MIIHAFIFASVLIAIYMTGIFILSLIKKDNSIVDTAYGIGFIIISWATLLVYGKFSFVQILVTSLITLWALRLSIRIYLRNKGKPEDFRYKKWRDEWTWFKTRSFFQIYVLQGAIIIGVSSIAIFINGSRYVGEMKSFSATSILFIVLGALAWAKGFFFEAVGDYQLDQFIKRKTGGIMKEGLWSMTRHPNYFGEMTMWWGLWIIALSVPHGYLTIVSPIIITFLLLKVSGIPMLEAKYKGNAEYEAYQKETNALIPWFK